MAAASGETQALQLEHIRKKKRGKVIVSVEGTRLSFQLRRL